MSSNVYFLFNLFDIPKIKVIENDLAKRQNNMPLYNILRRYNSTLSHHNKV